MTKKASLERICAEASFTSGPLALSSVAVAALASLQMDVRTDR